MIALNTLRTDTKRNEQRGLASIMKAVKADSTPVRVVDERGPSGQARRGHRPQLDAQLVTPNPQGRSGSG